MNILDRINLNLFYNNRGGDVYGNRYYESKSRGVTDKYRRVVKYNGMAEPTKVPPLWHAWLHHLKDTPPNEKELENQDWQREYMPNITGLNAQKIFSGYKAWKWNDKESDYE